MPRTPAPPLTHPTNRSNPSPTPHPPHQPLQPQPALNQPFNIGNGPVSHWQQTRLTLATDTFNTGNQTIQHWQPAYYDIWFHSLLAR